MALNPSDIIFNVDLEMFRLSKFGVTNTKFRDLRVPKLIFITYIYTGDEHNEYRDS